MNKRIFSALSLLLACLCLLMSCHRPQTKKNQIYKVNKMNTHKTLYFTGVIQPIHEVTLTSPIEGVIKEMKFFYGQYVNKNNIVFVIHSQELQKQYNDTLTEYLKAKDNYLVADAKFRGTNELWQAGLISKNNYLNEKSALNTTKVTLMQTKRKLAEIRDKMGLTIEQDLAKLSFAQFEKVKLALDSSHNHIFLKAPQSGLLLYPPKTTDDKDLKMGVGNHVKSDEVLAMIGDLSGIKVEIDVPEIDIAKVNLGMAAIIRCTAFPNQSLKGEIVAINSQATVKGTTNLPSFSAVVEVKDLTPTWQKKLKVGMSATIEIAIENQDKILIPISAVMHEKGSNKVKILSQNKIEDRLIRTGAIFEDKVIVESGLKQGERIIL